jgi:hypothetical protein
MAALGLADERHDFINKIKVLEKQIELYRQILDSLKYVTDNRVALRQNAQVWSELIGVSEGEAAKQMFRSPTQPEGSPKSTMYFSKLKPEAVGERAGDKQIRLRAEAVARARAAEIAALPPYNETFGKFNRLSSSEREAILLKYGISSSGTNQERYTRLMAVNRKK